MTPGLVGALAVGVLAVLGVGRRKVHRRRRGVAVVPHHVRRVVDGGGSGGIDAPERLDVIAAPGRQPGGEQRGADRAGEDVGRDVGHLMVAEGADQQHLLGLDARVGVGGEVLRVRIVLAPVPEQLGQLEGDDSIERIGVGLVEDRLELGPVATSG